jgi:hypothetical protein
MRRASPPSPIRQCEGSRAGRLDVLVVLQPIYDEINEQYGTNEKPRN